MMNLLLAAISGLINNSERFMSNPDLLVIGCGDLGGACAQFFAAQGWSVIGVRRQHADIPGVDMIAADVTSPESLTALRHIAPTLVLIVLTPGAFNDERYRRVYVEGLRNTLAAFDQSRLQHIVWVSSTSVLSQNSNQNDDSVLDERSHASPPGFSGQRLLEAEQLLAASKLPHTIVRFGGIYGPGRERLLKQLRDGNRTPARPVRISNRIHRDDAVGILQFLLSRAFTQSTLDSLYLAVDTEPTPIADVERWFANFLGIDYNNLREQESEMRGGNRRYSSARLQQLGYQFLYPSFREGLPTLL